MRGVLGLSLLPLLAVASPLREKSIHKDAAPVLSASNAAEIADNYIVVFKKHVTHNLAVDHHSWVNDIHKETEQVKLDLRRKRSIDAFGGLKHTYNIAGSLLGYAGHFDEDVVEQIRRHPDVDFIEKDQEVHVLESNSTVEKNAPWGLARISHRKSLGLSNYNQYLYTEEGGEGVDVYVIDTGTNVNHVDFEGRATWYKTVPQGDKDEDGNGHGTHCSGTVGGRKYGVAKKAHIKAIKVLRSNGSGSMSDVILGVQEAAEGHLAQVEAAKKGKRKGFKGSTANMSLGGGKSNALDQAVNAAVDAGIHFAVAAGNDNADSCKYSPAAAVNAVTVGASTFADERAYFSNYGPCNDIFAPGLNIESTWIGSKYAINTISGTSMASPHIAGLLAYMLSLQPAKDSAYAVADITPKKLKANLIKIGTVGALTSVPSDTTNVLAWNGGGSSNYSAIVEAGGYVMDSTKQMTKSEPVWDLDFDEILETGEVYKEEVSKYVETKEQRLASKVEELSSRIEELEELFYESLVM